MKLSVHILTYNSERYIKDALDSVIRQKTTFPFEIIIGDDASSDDTFNIIEKYAEKHKHIKALQNKNNLGILKNFKATLDRCSGKYIFDLAGDDWLSSEDALQILVDALDMNLTYSFVDSGYDVFFEYRKKTRRFHNKKILNELTYAKHVQTIGTPNVGCCFRKSALDKFVDFDHYIEMGFKIEDYPILTDLTQNCSFGFVYESLITYRVHKTSYSSNSHDFLDLKMFFAEKYGYSKDDIVKIKENYYYTKLVSASVHFKPKDGNIAFKNLRGKKILHYALYLSSQNRLFYKVLWFFRTLRF